MATIRILGPQDGAVLERVADDVFDNPVNPAWAAEFLNDPRHHLAVAIEDDQVVGMASAVHYIHPDKPPELWINEVGVDESYHRQGLGRQLLEALFERGRTLGCQSAWVLTNYPNLPARGLYQAVGGEEDPDAVVMVTFSLAPQ